MTVKIGSKIRETVEADGAQSIQRALRVLRFLSARVENPPSAAEVAQGCGLTKPTAHRILGALASEQFASLDEETRRYGLGLSSYILGLSASARYDLAFFARPSLRRLADATLDTCFLSVRLGNEAVCIGREVGAFPIKILTLDVGHRRPLGVGAGSLALLAFAADDDVEAVLSALMPDLAHYPEFSVAELRVLARASRDQGFASNEGRLIPEMSAVGVPILGPSGEVLGALSVAAIGSRLSGAHRDRVVELLRKEAATVAKAATRGVRPAEVPGGAASFSLAQLRSHR